MRFPNGKSKSFRSHQIFSCYVILIKITQSGFSLISSKGNASHWPEIYEPMTFFGVASVGWTDNFLVSSSVNCGGLHINPKLLHQDWRGF